MVVSEDLKKILLGEQTGDYCRDTKISIVKMGQKIEIDMTQMYGPPPITFAMLKQLSDYFGTEQIDVDNSCIEKEGCETCDYGSEYGHSIQILNATRNNE